MLQPEPSNSIVAGILPRNTISDRRMFLFVIGLRSFSKLQIARVNTDVLMAFRTLQLLDSHII